MRGAVGVSWDSCFFGHVPEIQGKGGWQSHDFLGKPGKFWQSQDWHTNLRNTTPLGDIL